MKRKKQNLPGEHPAPNQSINQLQRKMTADRSRRYFRDHPESAAESGQPVGSSITIVDALELRTLLSTGVFGSGQEAELAAAVHVVGSLISRVLPVQMGRAA